MDKIKIILSGGGTGGHIYPAVAVAEALQRRLGDGVELLFVGAEGKMEMEKIPALGYRIEGLPVAGLQRRLTARNLSLPFKVAASLRKARRVIRSFGADVVVGFGERTGAVERPAHGYSDADPGAELLRRGDEQAARIAGQTHLRGLRGDGAFLSEGAHRDDGQSVARTFCLRGGPGSTEGRSIGLFRARSG